MKKIFFLFATFLLMLTGSAIAQKSSHASKSAKKKKTAKVQYGVASFYANKFNGRKTANGDIFTHKKFTAAHNGLPLGTWVRVMNLKNKKSVVVKIIDRLHPRNRRLIDLSRAAADKLGFSSKGLLRVKVEVLGKKKPGT